MGKHKYSLLYVISFLLFLGYAGCDDESQNVQPDVQDTTTNEYIYHLMKEWYFWNNYLPDIDPDQYDSPQDLMEALKYRELDRWSFITDIQSFQQFFQEGKFIGYGFGLKLDPSGNLKLSFVYPGSPAEQAGLSRGTQVMEINGTEVPELLNSNKLTEALGEDIEGVTTDFKFKYLDGRIENISISKSTIEMTTVLNKKIFDLNGKRIGYMVFTNFVDKAVPELDDAFNYFKNEQIDEFILDLRYNSGGGLSVTDHLAGLLRKSDPGNIFLNITYNDQKQKFNNIIYFKDNAAALSLDRIFVITTGSTASASEAIINGLRPYIDVITVGEATSGKPMGMNVFEIDQLAVAPVTFKVNNSLGAADYFNGIEADYISVDDLDNLLGDENEACVGKILAIVHGEPARMKTLTPERKTKSLKLSGFRSEIGAF